MLQGSESASALSPSERITPSDAPLGALLAKRLCMMIFGVDFCDVTAGAAPDTALINVPFVVLPALCTLVQYAGMLMALTAGLQSITLAVIPASHPSRSEPTRRQQGLHERSLLLSHRL